MLKELSGVLSLNNSMNNITLKGFAELVIADKKMNMPYIPMPEGRGFTAHFVKKKRRYIRRYFLCLLFLTNFYRTYWCK